MYTDDLISREELNEKIGGMRKGDGAAGKRVEDGVLSSDKRRAAGKHSASTPFRQIEDITDVREMTNAQLKRLIQKIVVDKDGNVDIYLRLMGDLGLG